VPEHGGHLSITVDRDLCTGSGVCIAYAPATFGHDGDTKAVVIDPEGDSVPDIRNAAEGCPTGAILLVDGEGA
jgi:ferredoxin